MRPQPSNGWGDRFQLPWSTLLLEHVKPLEPHTNEAPVMLEHLRATDGKADMGRGHQMGTMERDKEGPVVATTR